MNNALVYIHIFADGSKYFGNAVRPSRPFDFQNRNNKWLEAYAKNGSPVVQTKYNMAIGEADALEQWLFDRYIAKGGLKLQKRPNAIDLAKAYYSNLGNKHAVGNKGFTGKRKHTEAARAKISKAQKGKPKSPTAIANSTARSHRKVVSMLDGRVASAVQAGHWNKKNPNYIGTWVDL